MKLLFDENLSPKLPRLVESLYPGSAHVRECGLKGKSDEEIWEYARHNGFTLISKDGEMRIADLLRQHCETVRRWETAPESILSLS